MLFQIGFRPLQEIKAKLGDEQTIHTGPSTVQCYVTTRWYNPSDYLELVISVCSMITNTTYYMCYMYNVRISKVKHAISLRLG